MSQARRYEELMGRILSMSEQEREGGEGLEMLAEAFSIAPPEIRAAVSAKMKELDLLPAAEFVDDAGTVFFSAEAVAEKLGCTADEIRSKCREMGARLPQPDGELHRIH